MDIKRLFAKGLRRLLQPAAMTECRIDKRARVCTGAQINYSTVGRYSYIGDNSFMVNAHVGYFCSIADNCRLGGATHPMERVSMSPVFHHGRNCLKKSFADFTEIETKKTVIESDVWIGANSIVISGVHIGVGAVIGAGSVVTKSVPAYQIWAGNPAKFIRERFPESIKEGLLSSKWWEWSDEKIEKYASCFDNPEMFIARVLEDKII